MALLLASCQSTTVTADDIQRMEQAIVALAAPPPPSFTADALGELDGLALPVKHHLSAVQYCAFVLRHVEADERVIATARERAGWRVVDGPSPSTGPIDLETLYPIIRSPPSFTRQAPATSTGRTYLDPDVGTCTILTIGEPGAQERTAAWLKSPDSKWVKAGGNRSWRAYKVRAPERMLQHDLRVIEAVLPADAKSAGITGLHVVALTGLP